MLIHFFTFIAEILHERRRWMVALFAKFLPWRCHNRTGTLSRFAARIVAATPHSCDVERLISAYNRLKTIDRSSLAPETLNDYLHVIVNMPDLADYNASSQLLDEWERQAGSQSFSAKNEWLLCWCFQGSEWQDRAMYCVGSWISDDRFCFVVQLSRSETVFHTLMIFSNRLICCKSFIWPQRN